VVSASGVGDCFVIALDPLSGAPKRASGSAGFKPISGSRIVPDLTLHSMARHYCDRRIQPARTPARRAAVRRRDRPRRHAWSLLSARWTRRPAQRRTSLESISKRHSTYGRNSSRRSNGNSGQRSNRVRQRFFIQLRSHGRRCRELPSKVFDGFCSRWTRHRVIRAGKPGRRYRAQQIILSWIPAPSDDSRNVFNHLAEGQRHIYLYFGAGNN